MHSSKNVNIIMHPNPVILLYLCINENMNVLFTVKYYLYIKCYILCFDFQVFKRRAV